MLLVFELEVKKAHKNFVSVAGHTGLAYSSNKREAGGMYIYVR